MLPRDPRLRFSSQRRGGLVHYAPVGRTLRLAVVAGVLCGCSPHAPSLLDGRQHTIVSGKGYRFSVPIAGCGAPVVQLNDKNWAPIGRSIAPFPKTWHAHESGDHTTYVTGTVRLVRGLVQLELRDGTVIRYGVTSERFPSNVCA